MLKKRKPAAKRKPAVKRKTAAKQKPAAKKRPALSPSSKAPPPGKEIGRVVAFFRIPVVAVVRITRGKLKIGDRIWIKGHTTDLKETVASMQINHQPIQEAKKGAEIGLKVSARARRGDRVILLPV